MEHELRFGLDFGQLAVLEKKQPEKLLIIGPNYFFLVMPTGSNLAQILIPVP